MPKINSFEDVEKCLEEISTSIAKELTDIKVKNFQINSRFEALLRNQITRGKISYDEYIWSLDSYSKLSATLRAIGQEQTVVAKLAKALEHNSLVGQEGFQVYADDLGVLSIIEANGGTSSETAKFLLDLPHTTKFKNSIAKYLVITPTEVIVPTKQKPSFFEENFEATRYTPHEVYEDWEY